MGEEVEVECMRGSLMVTDWTCLQYACVDPSNIWGCLQCRHGWVTSHACAVCEGLLSACDAPHTPVCPAGRYRQPAEMLTQPPAAAGDGFTK